MRNEGKLEDSCVVDWLGYASGDRDIIYAQREIPKTAPGRGYRLNESKSAALGARTPICFSPSCIFLDRYYLARASSRLW